MMEYSTMREIPPETLRQMQRRGLEMLLYFQRICQAHNLMFYLCGGCLIGAVRHGGFIPWDDDVDIFMPREDYERLPEIWAKYADTARYSYNRTDRDHYTRNQFATINDNQTTFIKSYQADLDINHGLSLDILPLDGYPKSKWKRRTQVMWALLYSLFEIGQAPDNHGKAVRWGGRLLLALVPFSSWRYRLWRLAERRMTRFPIAECDAVTELCSGPYYMKKKYPAEAFRGAVLHEFEGHMVPVPQGYDDYLRIAFGDYMQLPPEEKRACHHAFEKIDMDKRYTAYKGVYYCRDKKTGAPEREGESNGRDESRER